MPPAPQDEIQNLRSDITSLRDIVDRLDRDGSDGPIRRAVSIVLSKRQARLAELERTVTEK
jgi:hypothetical protein